MCSGVLRCSLAARWNASQMAAVAAARAAAVAASGARAEVAPDVALLAGDREQVDTPQGLLIAVLQ